MIYRPQTSWRTALCLCIVATALSATPRSVAAVAIDGVEFPPYVLMSGYTKPVKLHGVGRLTRNFVSNFAGALYLPPGELDPEGISAGLQPLKLDLVSRMPDMTEAQTQAYWRDAFAESVTDDEIRRRIGPSVDRFCSMFSAFSKGDKMSIEYHPDAGSTIYINGLNLGSMIGIDFNRTLLSLFFGDRGAVKAFREQLLTQVDL